MTNISFVNPIDISLILRRQCRRVPHSQTLKGHRRRHPKSCFEKLVSLINCCDNHNKSLFEYLHIFLKFGIQNAVQVAYKVFFTTFSEFITYTLWGFKCNQMFLQFFYPKSMGSKVFVWQSGEILIANRIVYILLLEYKTFDRIIADK